MPRGLSKKQKLLISVINNTLTQCPIDVHAEFIRVFEAQALGKASREFNAERDPIITRSKTKNQKSQ